MKRALVIGCVVVGLMAAGCTPKPSVVGKWNGEIPVGTMRLPATFEFKPDGKMTTVAEFQGITITAQSTYKVSGDQLTAKTESFDLSGATLTPAMKAGAQAEFEKMKGVEERSTLVFKNEDTIEATDPQGGKWNWTRVK